MTKKVVDEFKNGNPNDESIKESWWEIQQGLNVPGYTGDIYGGNVIFTIFKE
ncbi:hypothetical protein ACWGNU_28800 [Paenibacillus lautus]